MHSDPIDLASLRRRVGRYEDGHLLQIRVGVLRRLLADFDAQEPAQPREEAILGRRSLPTSDPDVTEEELVFASDWEAAAADVERQNRR